MEVKKILITDNVHPVMMEMLEVAGFECHQVEDVDYDGLLKVVDDYDAMVVRSKVRIDKAFLDKCHRLKCIGRVGAGMETIDVECAEAKGVRCLNSPEGNRDAVGEHAVGLLLTLFDKIASADAEVREGLWQREENRGLEVKGKTIGIIGMGNMGGSFGRRLRGFDCEVIYYDLKGELAEGRVGLCPEAESVTREELMRGSDVVSLHVPLTDETRYMVNEDFLNEFAKPIYLINTSRGAVVDTEGLVRAMKSGKVLGAALDVIEYEQMEKDSMGGADEPEALRYLKESRRAVLTPHVAGWTVESKEKLASVLATKIIETLKTC